MNVLARLREICLASPETYEEPAYIGALSNSGHPFFKTTWPPDMIGLVIEDDADWAEIAELLTDSYCVMAPRKLVERLGTRDSSHPAE